MEKESIARKFKAQVRQLSLADDDFPSLGFGAPTPAPVTNGPTMGPPRGVWGKAATPARVTFVPKMATPPPPVPQLQQVRTEAGAAYGWGGPSGTGMAATVGATTAAAGVAAASTPCPWKVVGKMEVVEVPQAPEVQESVVTNLAEEVNSLRVSTENFSDGSQHQQQPPPQQQSQLQEQQLDRTTPSPGARSEGGTAWSARATSPSSGASAGAAAPAPAPVVKAWAWGNTGGAAATTVSRPVASPSPPTSIGRGTAPAPMTSVPAISTSNLFKTPPSVGFGGGRGRGGGFGGDERGGGGRGRGRGRGRGMDRKDRPNPDLICNQLESIDVVKSRPTNDDGLQQTKRGKQGKTIDLTTNYFHLESLTNFNLFHYHVEFKPDEERTEVRKKLVKVHETTLGAFIFDGQALYTPHRLTKNPLLLYSMNAYNNQKTQLSIRQVAEITPVDTVFLQVYNIIFRNIMTILELEPLGRFYYDPGNKTLIQSRKLEVWPGYITSVRNHEDKILLNLELTHKVVRSDTVLDFINNTKASMGGHSGAGGRGGNYKFEIMKHLLGCIVLTRYNKKNYKIDDIKWDITPSHEFKMRDGKSMSYRDYYKSQYGVIIKDPKQPMLVSLPKKKDYHRGSKQPIYLVPEICQMTGLNDSMRKDMSLMKDLTGHLVLSPAQRVSNSNGFIERLYNSPKINEEFDRWNIKVSRTPMKCLGRVVDLDDLLVGGAGGVAARVKQDKPGDWTNLFKSKPMLSTVPMKKWILISCQKSEQVAEQLVTTLRSTSKSMGFTVDNPMMRMTLRDNKPTTFSAVIHQLYEQTRKSVQMVVALLPNNNSEVYAAIKRKCICELGISSQCILVKTMLTKNPGSVTSRLAIQMNSKLGGEPWTVDIPLKDLMIVGYDVYHSGGNKRAPSVGALVATTSSTLAKYFTSTCFHKSRNELSANLCSQMTNALHSYKMVNRGKLPSRIILYRDGVGDGQLSYIFNTELTQIKEALRMVYANDVHHHLPKFSFIVVTKRIHTRVYGPPEMNVSGTGTVAVNPPPGTVVDDVITRPERYDFYLVSQAVNNLAATVSPTSYNVLSDEQGLDPDKMQRLTLKLCHLYYNYTGTIAVPAPCQFAHKLAYLTGMSLSNPTDGRLENLLYFL